jgi:hypothetical protein
VKCILLVDNGTGAFESVGCVMSNYEFQNFNVQAVLCGCLMPEFPMIGSLVARELQFIS